uniref:Uncharacterized protein n=2 Tax=Rhodnius prolixus TaxID=13249 RepID=T1HCM3_RHOPR
MENAEGHWAVEIPKMDEPLCAAIDPSSDYRWQPLPCSGPTVAAFICQMQVPPWAQTEDGCMLTSLPSLTVTFLPEQGAVELISDCGLEGTRRIACKGQAKREDMMRQLSCETSTEATSSDTWDDQPTRHRRESEVTQDMSSHPNTTQDMGTTDEEITTTEQTVTTEAASTAQETSVEDPAKKMTAATTAHIPTQSHAELALPLNDQPALPETGSSSSSSSSSGAPQTKKPYSSKPIPPSLKGNSPFVETPIPLVTPTRMNVSDETEGPPDSHETLGREGEPSKTPASPATHPSLEQYKKNVHDSGEDHTEETGGPTSSSNKNNITSASAATSGDASSSTASFTPDMLADEPDLPERPNRGRLLVHPQHHSFYAYFLNRVLG